MGGTVAAGWPARGRLVGSVIAGSPVPSLIEDGAHGFYAAWIALTIGTVVLGVHIGPDNASAGGWNGDERELVPSTPIQTGKRWPQLALAPEGGAFLAWRSSSSNPNIQPSGYRLLRLTAAGLPFAGWAAEGLVVQTDMTNSGASPMLAVFT